MLSAGSSAAVGRPRWRSFIGTTSAPRATTTTRMVASGTRVTVCTHHPKMPPERSPLPTALVLVDGVSVPAVASSFLLALAVTWAGFGPRPRRDFRGRSLSPIRPMKAGSIVRAMTTARATPTAAKTPMTVRKGILAMANPMRAMTTVVPAKTTADPDVATARAADSCTSKPSRN